VNEYIAYQLVTGYGSDAEVQAILDAYDFYIIPVVNPDGKFTLQPYLDDY
jgi:murein tripeptide amidase MpaA